MQQIEFDKWYEQGQSPSLITYMFAKQERDTSVFVRAQPSDAAEFLLQLALTYGTSYASRYPFRDIKSKLEEVIRSGELIRENEFVFGDDRVKYIRKLDDPSCIEGPLRGDNRYLEIRFNEQYGGEYPSEISSRGRMVNKVLAALENVSRTQIARAIGVSSFV